MAHSITNRTGLRNAQQLWPQILRGPIRSITNPYVKFRNCNSKASAGRSAQRTATGGDFRRSESSAASPCSTAGAQAFLRRLAREWEGVKALLPFHGLLRERRDGEFYCVRFSGTRYRRWLGPGASRRDELNSRSQAQIIDVSVCVIARRPASVDGHGENLFSNALR
jgi:hypothetical protein